MANVIQQALGAFMRSLGLLGWTRSWEAHERDQQFVENECIDNPNSQRLRKVGNIRTDKASAMRPDLAKICTKVPTSRYCDSGDSDHHTVANACYIDYANIWSSKRVH